MKLTDLSVLDSHYDVLVVNRCLQFFGDPIGYVRDARRLLAPGGLLMATGLQSFRDSTVKIREVATLRQSVQERFDFDLFVNPTKGYLDDRDRDGLQALEIRLSPYARLWRANLKSVLVPTPPRHMYGTWMHP